jgi:hypothetical protein
VPWELTPIEERRLETYLVDQGAGGSASCLPAPAYDRIVALDQTTAIRAAPLDIYALFGGPGVSNHPLGSLGQGTMVGPSVPPDERVESESAVQPAGVLPKAQSGGQESMLPVVLAQPTAHEPGAAIPTGPSSGSGVQLAAGGISSGFGRDKGAAEENPWGKMTGELDLWSFGGEQEASISPSPPSPKSALPGGPAGTGVQGPFGCHASPPHSDAMSCGHVGVGGIAVHVSAPQGAATALNPGPSQSPPGVRGRSSQALPPSDRIQARVTARSPQPGNDWPD